MASKLEIAPELVAEGRRAFEETNTPQREIAAMMGISPDTLRDRAREWNWQRFSRSRRALEMLHAVRGAEAAPQPAPAVDAPPAAEPMPSAPFSPEQRAALALRIQKVVEREMTAVERLLDRDGASDQSASASNARALAGIARTLREVAILNKPDETMPLDEAKDDPIPRDIDEFRRELARRINAFVDARENRRDGDGGLPDAGETMVGS